MKKRHHHLAHVETYLAEDKEGKFAEIVLKCAQRNKIRSFNERYVISHLQELYQQKQQYIDDIVIQEKSFDIVYDPAELNFAK